MAGVPTARDEYYGYLPKVFGLIKEDRGEVAIAHYLTQVAVEAMALPENAAHNLKAAQILVEWREVIRALEI